MVAMDRIRCRLLRFEVPSTAFIVRARRKVKILALLAVRNHLLYLPDYIANVAPQVDGIVALDDGSTDGSAEFLEARSELIEVLRVPANRPRWDEVGNFRALVSAALRHDPEWLISLDADERVEREFRGRAERVIGRGRCLGYTAYAVHLRELWDSPGYYRADGIWGEKTPARLFQARADHQFDTRPLHATKAPLQARIAGQYPLADLNIYHLAMLRAEDRMARRRRYEQLDPEARWQRKVGYAYLTDERGLRLQAVSASRDYVVRSVAELAARVSSLPVDSIRRLN
jgi:glycosyltransferase involved in cell wall biosynthesis